MALRLLRHSWKYTVRGGTCKRCGLSFRVQTGPQGGAQRIWFKKGSNVGIVLNATPPCKERI